MIPAAPKEWLLISDSRGELSVLGPDVPRGTKIKVMAKDDHMKIVLELIRAAEGVTVAAERVTEDAGKLLDNEA